MWLRESTGMEMMCFDGKGWLAPTRGQRVAGSEKMPNNRLRQDINQISLETIQHTQIHTAFSGVCRCFGASATRLVTSKFGGNRSMEK